MNKILVFLIFLIFFASQSKANDTDSLLRSFYIDKITVSSIGNSLPKIQYIQIEKDIFQVKISWSVEKKLIQDDTKIVIKPSFIPSFHWAPHLTPEEGYIISQRVFRSPALFVADDFKEISIIPDLDMLKKSASPEWYMDLNALNNTLILGMSKSAVAEHVLFQKEKGAMYNKGIIEFGFYILKTDLKISKASNPWRKALSFMWEKWGEQLFNKGEPLPTENINRYVEQTYKWAFENWRQNVWQEFELEDKKVGAPVFIVNVTQSPNYPSKINEREFRSIWNQAWFNSLRSASGLYRYAKKTNNKEYEKYALLTKELALSFPQYKGFFPSVVATEMEEVEIEGKMYNRSKGWQTKYFANSNRNPYSWDPIQSPYHVVDMSYTAYLMLCWYADLEKDKRLLEYAINYADALLAIQQKNGFFPGWLSLKDFKPMQHLNESPESSMSVTFLLKLYQLTKNKKYYLAAEKAMQAVITNIIPISKWEDFETYWSCSRFGADTLVGKRISRNNMYKQNTLSMYWTAQALLEMFKITQHKKYLIIGQRVLDEMLMYQAIWQPPFIHINTLGGFGVMNADAEWNDSRQSLFAPLISDYGKALNSQEYNQRAIAALKASFTMMYTPLNPKTFSQWNYKWNFFGEKDYGFMMENYGHDGQTNSEGLGIGEFTIYDWGNGTAAEAYSKMKDNDSTLLKQ